VLSVQTSHDWSAVSATVTVGAVAEVWTCAATSNSAVDALEDLCAWANDAARGWFPAALFQWGWARDSSTGGALLKIKNSGGPFSWAPNLAAIQRLGVVAGGPAVELVGASDASGTWAPEPAGLLSLRLGRVYHDKAPGQGSGVGAVRPGLSGLAPWAGECAPIVGPVDARRWPEVSQVAAHPRRAWLRLAGVSGSDYVVPPIGAHWARFALGPVRRSRVGGHLWRLDFGLAGEAV